LFFYSSLFNSSSNLFFRLLRYIQRAKIATKIAARITLPYILR